MAVHLDDPKYKTEKKGRGDRRNGHSQKTIKGEFGEATLDIPRDRNSEFEPVRVKKGQTRFNGFDGKIFSLYGRGMTTRDIQAQLKDRYGVEVSATLISQVTNAVLDEVKAWQCRPLSAVHWFSELYNRSPPRLFYSVDSWQREDGSTQLVLDSVLAAAICSRSGLVIVNKSA